MTFAKFQIHYEPNGSWAPWVLYESFAVARPNESFVSILEELGRFANKSDAEQAMRQEIERHKQAEKEKAANEKKAAFYDKDGIEI